MPKEKQNRRGILRYFLDHHNVPFGAGDNVGFRVLADDTDHSLSCDDSPLTCSFP